MAVISGCRPLEHFTLCLYPNLVLEPGLVLINNQHLCRVLSSPLNFTSNALSKRHWLTIRSFDSAQKPSICDAFTLIITRFQQNLLALGCRAGTSAALSEITIFTSHYQKLFLYLRESQPEHTFKETTSSTSKRKLVFHCRLGNLSVAGHRYVPFGCRSILLNFPYALASRDRS